MPGSDKLSIISQCLLLKGQNIPATEDDGSDEWNVCSAAYDRGVAHLLEEHSWNFATEIATPTRTGDATDANFEDAYARPNGCLQIIWVHLDDLPTPYRIIGNSIELIDGDGVVTVKFVKEPDAGQWPAMFISAVQEWVFAGIEGGLKKEAQAARAHMRDAELYLQKARTRVDQQEPKRALFKTRHRTARQFRRGG